MDNRASSYWSMSPEDLLTALNSTRQGLTAEQAEHRLAVLGMETLKPHPVQNALLLYVHQFANPLILILLFSIAVSAVVGEWVDAAVVLVVIIVSSALTFVQEYNASNAIEDLLERVEIKSTVLRGDQPTQIPTKYVVPGDIVWLSAGDLVPGDGVLLQAKDCFVDQAALTGEAYPVEKQPGVVPATAPLSERSNCVFLGTSLRSGTAVALMAVTGAETAYGEIARRLAVRPPETEFERGIRQFSYLLVRIILMLVLFVLTVNVFTNKPVVESLLFAIALAVGIAPEMLPAIVTITLSSGARRMAAEGVIVRRLNSIENFGNMDVLCTDKTGTLTEGKIQFDRACDTRGEPSESVLLRAFLNAALQVGMRNPLDDALLAMRGSLHDEVSQYTRIDEIPYDFERRRLSVIVRDPAGTTEIITKGAYLGVVSACGHVMVEAEPRPLTPDLRQELDERYSSWGAQGLRVLGVARKPVGTKDGFEPEDEQGLVFEGFLTFFDPPKADVRAALVDLAALGVELKIISGDNVRVVQYVAAQVGLPMSGLLTGAQLDSMRDEALWQVAEHTNLFVEVDPNQKERIIRALQKTGHVVGYMGDGINDAPALHVADVGISVDSAVDVAKEAADFVLLEHSLKVLRDGIVVGRQTFANTLKYIFTTTSANFGNMFSMAGLSLFLPYLPLLPKQILLNNLLSDLPGMAIAGDHVDPEWIARPGKWDVRLIRSFMIVFGLVSSLFDFLTFGVLLGILNATPEQFRTGWFVESLLTELVIALVVRTRRPFYRSRPGRWLLWTTIAVAVVALALPYLGVVADLFDFVPLPPSALLLIILLTALYVLTTELVKRRFFRQANPARTLRPGGAQS